MAHLGNCILATQPRDTSEGLQLNFQQNINDTMTVLPKLSTGLDVNVRFTGVSDFEYTPECIVFDLLNIPLYHGWLVDPQSPEQVQAVGKLSYNQLVEKIITCKHASDSRLVSEGLVAEQFLESTASQLTFHGLCELMARAREGELGVFFRNNHFSTMTKHKGHLYLLVTDQGFLQEEGVVWESLHSVDGDSCFCDSEFHLSHPLGKDRASTAPPRTPGCSRDKWTRISWWPCPCSKDRTPPRCSATWSWRGSCSRRSTSSTILIVILITLLLLSCSQRRRSGARGRGRIRTAPSSSTSCLGVPTPAAPQNPALRPPGTSWGSLGAGDEG
uniref:Ubiquitin carboxyl-terminal hydrolase n=1 Tax=Geospiza parvula TaxID=87175 RepID=A0A8C3N9X5_GEOPR